MLSAALFSPRPEQLTLELTFTESTERERKKEYKKLCVGKKSVICWTTTAKVKCLELVFHTLSRALISCKNIHKADWTLSEELGCPVCVHKKITKVHSQPTKKKPEAQLKYSITVYQVENPIWFCRSSPRWKNPLRDETHFWQYSLPGLIKEFNGFWVYTATRSGRFEFFFLLAKTKLVNQMQIIGKPAFLFAEV